MQKLLLVPVLALSACASQSESLKAAPEKGPHPDKVVAVAEKVAKSVQAPARAAPRIVIE